MKEFHGSHLMEHCSDKVTTNELSKLYYWPVIKNNVNKYIATCSNCQMNFGKCGNVHRHLA